MEKEFAPQPTFFVSISLHHVFEHLLHVHSWQYTGNTMSVLAFRVPINVIHGDIVPPGYSAPFSVHWFQSADLKW